MDNTLYRTDYFVYHNTAYGVGTKVIFTDEFYHKYYYSNDAQGQAYTFVRGLSNGVSLFHWDECNDSHSVFNSTIELLHPDQDIKEIVSPVYVNIVPWQHKAVDNIIHNKAQPDIFGGCLLYAIIMIVGLIFIDRWLIWVAGTFIFIAWLLKQYRI